MQPDTPTTEEMHTTEALRALLVAHRYLERLEALIERGTFAPRYFESALEALDELEAHAQHMRMTDASLSRADLWKT